MAGLSAPFTGRGKERHVKPVGGNVPASRCGWSPALHDKSGTSGKVARKTKRTLTLRAKKVPALAEVMGRMARMAASGMSIEAIRITYVEHTKASGLDRAAALLLLSYINSGNGSK